MLMSTLPTHPFLDAAGKIHNRDIGHRNTESHSGQLSIEGWNDFANSLGGSSGRWNDVLGSGSPSSPVLVAWSIHSLLCGSVRMYSSHEGLNDREVLVDHFG